MVRTKIKIASPEGLHARPAAKIVTACKDVDSEITILNGNRTAKGNSILELLLLGIVGGSEIEIVAEGSEEELAIRKIIEICRNNKT